MPGKHKNPTISFRVSDYERRAIEANIKMSGMLKKDYFIRSCIYNRVCVVGKKETIYPLVEELRKMQEKMAELGEQFQAEGIKLDIVKMQIQEAVDDFEDMQKQADFVKEEAMQQYEKYRRVEPGERGMAMFDDMLRLKRENMILKDENRTLKEKLIKVYDFMKQFTINGLNMLECFLESVGERVQNFSENIGFGGRIR